MSLTLGIVLYIMIWWMTLFAVLPIGVRTQGEAGEVVDGDTFSFATGGNFLNNYFGSLIDPGLPNILSGPLALGVTATELEISQQPPVQASPGTPFDMQARFIDANGNLDSDVNGDVLTITRSDAGAVTSGATGTAVSGIVDLAGGNAVVLGAPSGLGIHLVLTDDAAGSVDLSAMPVVSAVFDLFLDDADGTLSAGSLVPGAIDSVAGAILPVDVFEFVIADGGTSDGNPLSVSALSIDLAGSTADADDATWTLNGPSVGALVGVVSGTVGSQSIQFNSLAVSVPDGLANMYTLSMQMVVSPTGTVDNEVYLFALSAADVVVASGGTSLSPTTAVNTWPAVPWSVSATDMSVSQPPPPNAYIGEPFPVEVSFVDVSGNLDSDVNGDVLTAVRDDAGTVTFGISQPAVNGIAGFVSGNRLVLGGPEASGISLVISDDAGGSVDFSAVSIISSPFDLAKPPSSGSGDDDEEGCVVRTAALRLPLVLLLLAALMAVQRARRARQ